MRVEDVAPRTLLLAVVAGWALAAWFLALAGMGSRLPAPASGATAPPVPQVPKPAPPVLGPLAQYAGTAARPVFAADRRPHAFYLAGQGATAPAASEFDLVLTSVLITPQAQLALVQRPAGGEAMRVKMGDAPESQPSWHLISLAPRSAVFQGPEGQKTLKLRVYDGKGGNAAPGPGMQVPSLPVDPPASMPGSGGFPSPTVPPPMPIPNAGPGAMPVSPPAPPATDTNLADPSQIDAIRRRIEERRAAVRKSMQNPAPPATVPPPPTP